MSRPFHSQPSHNAADGVVETNGGAYVLKFERYFRHSIERVWAAITEPEQLVAWLAEADMTLSRGGHMQLRWLNTDEDGNSAVMNATITQFEPPRLLEYTGDLHGTLRWELREVDGGCMLTFSNTLPASAKAYLHKSLAGWHVHLDFLEEALDGQVVDWPNWPIERWSRHYERYCQTIV